jgi:hypothetical protein
MSDRRTRTQVGSAIALGVTRATFEELSDADTVTR